MRAGQGRWTQEGGGLCSSNSQFQRRRRPLRRLTALTPLRHLQGGGGYFRSALHQPREGWHPKRDLQATGLGLTMGGLQKISQKYKTTGRSEGERGGGSVSCQRERRLHHRNRKAVTSGGGLGRGRALRPPSAGAGEEGGEAAAGGGRFWRRLLRRGWHWFLVLTAHGQQSIKSTSNQSRSSQATSSQSKSSQRFFTLTGATNALADGLPRLYARVERGAMTRP
jgi:hypothetical protein